MKSPLQRSISIGIYAHNNEDSIKKLLDSIRKQQEKEILVKEIVVISDGSTDDTVNVVVEYPDPRVSLIHFPTFKGKASRMNYFLHHLKGDMYAFLEADTILGNTMTLTHLFRPMIKDDEMGVVGGRCIPFPSTTPMMEILRNHVEARFAVEHLFDFGTSRYAINGMLLGISKSLASRIIYPYNLSDIDGYTYFASVQLGYFVSYAKKANLYYRLPDKMNEKYADIVNSRHEKYTLNQFFPKEMIDRGYSLPLWLRFRIGFCEFIVNPFGWLLITGINISLFLQSESFLSLKKNRRLQRLSYKV